MADAIFLMDPETEDHLNVGLKPVANCPQCGRMSLSQIIICKGVNTPGNNGKRYQVVSHFKSNRK